MKAPTSSIGFLRLIEVNLPNKTLESVIIEHPHFESLIGTSNPVHPGTKGYQAFALKTMQLQGGDA